MDNSETPISLFLDLSKAFDLLDHNILLYKLKYYGINSNSLDKLELLENYLTNRKQYIEFEKHKSDVKNVTIGKRGAVIMDNNGRLITESKELLRIWAANFKELLNGKGAARARLGERWKWRRYDRKKWKQQCTR